MFLRKEKDSMIEVKVIYTNLPHTTKHTKTDFFVYREVEVKGHAEHTGYTNNTRVCAGISAITLGIIRLLDEKHKVEYSKGYFHVHVDCKIDKEFRNTCDKESVYALNTLVCQLFEIYKNYPNAFKRFDLIEEKENNDETRKSSNSNTKRTSRKQHKLGLYSITQSPNFEEN